MNILLMNLTSKMRLTMGRKYIKYDKDLICNICGRFGAYDFIDDDMFICPECLKQLFKKFTKLYMNDANKAKVVDKLKNSELKEELRKIIFSPEFGWVDNHEWMMDGDEATEILYEWFVKNANRLSV